MGDVFAEIMDYNEPLFFHLMQYARSADHDVIDMVSGDPDWGAPPEISEGLRRYADFGSDEFQYPPSEGLTELREEIADRRNIEANQVIVTHGAGEANYLGMAGALARDEGSEVVLADPVYPYYAGRINLLDGDAVFVPAGQDGHLDPEDVKEHVSQETGLILVNSPNNPTGAVYDFSVIRELIEVAEDHDAILVSDEVYDHFDYSGRFESAVTIESEHRVVTNSFSKSMAITGFRVGYAVFPDSLIGAAKTRHMLTNVAGSRPAQYAVLHTLREVSPDYYSETRHLLADRIEVFTESLEAVGAEYSTPEGGFYVLVRFQDFPGTIENAKQLIDEAGVAGMPGSTFGTTRTEWLRFALVTPRVREAADRLVAFFS